MNKTFKLSYEDELLLLCLRLNIDKNLRNRIKYLSKIVDWDYLVQKADQHKVIPLLYRNINSQIPEDVPTHILLNLRNIFSQNAKKNLFMLGEMLTILDLFDQNGIFAMPYKGLSLALLVYGNIALRQFGDLDIFINQENVIKAKKILISYGYKPYLTLSFAKEKKFIESQHDLQFFNSEKNIILELHWNVSSLFLYLPISEDRFLDMENLDHFNINNKSIVTFSPEDMFLILCIHNASHYWSRLSWVCDISEFVKCYKLKWSSIIEKANSQGVMNIVLINLYLAKDLLDLDLPEIILNKLDLEKTIESVCMEIKEKIFIHESEFTLYERAKLNLKIRDNIIFGIKDTIKGATRPTVYEWKNFQIPLFIYPIYIIIRPFLLLIRYNLKLYNQ